jgi:hypothetical protein
VQAARETGRRAQCENKLRQIGLALHNFEQRSGSFPPAMFQKSSQIEGDVLFLPGGYNQPPDYSNGAINQYSWLSKILPDLEQDNLYAQIRFDEFPFPHLMPGEMNLNGRIVPAFHCPSYPLTTEPLEYIEASGTAHYAHTHYLGVNGTDQFRYDGIIHVNSRVKLTDIKDGSSQTLLVGERPPPYDRFAGWWLAGSGWFPWFGAADVVLGTKERIAVNGAGTPTGPQSRYQPGNFNDESDGYNWYKHAWHFWSPHDGGAFFLFADGPVKFIPYSVSEDVFLNLGTYKGGEANHAIY